MTYSGLIYEVENLLPPPERRVLAYQKFRGWIVAYWNIHQGQLCWFEDQLMLNTHANPITHWLDLPDVPRDFKAWGSL